MPDDAPVHLGHQRNRQGAGGAQRLDDELLGVVADRQRREGRDGDVGDGVVVGRGFGADDDW